MWKDLPSLKVLVMLKNVGSMMNSITLKSTIQNVCLSVDCFSHSDEIEFTVQEVFSSMAKFTISECPKNAIKIIKKNTSILFPICSICLVIECTYS